MIVETNVEKYPIKLRMTAKCTGRQEYSDRTGNLQKTLLSSAKGKRKAAAHHKSPQESRTTP